MLFFPCLDLELSLLPSVLKFHVCEGVVLAEELVIACWLSTEVGEGDRARLISLSLDLSGLHLIV